MATSGTPLPSETPTLEDELLQLLADLEDGVVWGVVEKFAANDIHSRQDVQQLTIDDFKELGFSIGIRNRLSRHLQRQNLKRQGRLKKLDMQRLPIRLMRSIRLRRLTRLSKHTEQSKLGRPEKPGRQRSRLIGPDVAKRGKLMISELQPSARMIPRRPAAQSPCLRGQEPGAQA